MIVDVVTDNRNRTVSEIRHVFSKNGGNMGEAGSVAWMFSKKGYIAVDKSKGDEDTLMTLAIDAGADVIMLDNMTISEMADAVRLVNKRAWVEASGGITLETIRQIAETGVDFISSGALTHSAPVVDFNMKITMNVDR